MKDSPLTKIFTEFEEETMISNEVKERLLQRDWYVECKTEQEANLLLRACDDAGITWNFGYKATEFKPYKHYPVDIGFHEEEDGITYGTTYYKESEHENITDWFFNAIGKLTPQNAEQEHYVQILLAMMQNIPVECDFDDGDGWVDAAILYIDLDKKYRIKPTSTPLPITREMWAMIASEWKWAAMDSDGEVYFYTDEPCISARGFSWDSCGGDYCNSVLETNANSTNWRLSLTKRPEDV